MEWQRAVRGAWISPDGCWTIRGPMMGERMYWLYQRTPTGRYIGRYTPTGNYEDVVSFRTPKAAMDFVADLTDGKIDS